MRCGLWYRLAAFTRISNEKPANLARRACSKFTWLRRVVSMREASPSPDMVEHEVFELAIQGMPNLVGNPGVGDAIVFRRPIIGIEVRDSESGAGKNGRLAAPRGTADDNHLRNH
jgi:hypothetical protein